MLDTLGFLGTGASLASDLSLLAYILILVPLMLIGFFFARRKMFEPNHKLVMTSITLINWFIIIFLMFVRYSQAVQFAPGDPTLILPTIHLVFGGVAQLLATYLVIRMWFEKQLPAWFKVRRIKRYMRTTLALWIITAMLGIGIYVTWYVLPSNSSGGGEPVATPEVTPATEGDAEAETVETPEVTETEEAESDDAGDEAGESVEPVETPETTP